MGWPNGDSRTEVRSGLMQAARTITMTNPNSQQEPMAIRIPYGTALVALVASSDMCTQLSNPPTVQIAESHESMKVHPLGQRVMFSVCAKMYPPSLRCFLPIGRAMIVANIRMKFRMTKTVWSLPIIFDSDE